MNNRTPKQAQNFADTRITILICQNLNRTWNAQNALTTPVRSKLIQHQKSTTETEQLADFHRNWKLANRSIMKHNSQNSETASIVGLIRC